VIALNGIKLLLVDDEVEFMQTLMRRMKKRHVDVAGVNSGEEALAYLSENAIDVVVLDVKMPGMDGIETLREIKKVMPITEVIMLTGHANLEVAVEGMEIGAFDYLMKPINIDDLLYKIQDAYKKKTLHEQKIQSMQRMVQKNERFPDENDTLSQLQK
jgi:DNA-binding NtrC family response regulator